MIEFAPDAMETVRAAVVEGYYKLARGGVEVGGVLFGRRSTHGVQIADTRPIACQHAQGPSFVLSESDQAGLALMLEQSASDPVFEGLVPVGWYHSHTRSGFELSALDLDICARFFPEPWQVALVLCPDRMKPTRGVFYVQAEDNSPRAEPEFVLEPQTGPRKMSPAPVELPRQVEPPAPPAAAAPSPPEPASPPEGIVPPAPRSSRMYWALFAAAWCIAVGSAAFAFRGCWMPQPPVPVQLSLFDAAGQLSVRWEHSSRQIQEAEGGTLEIRDAEKVFSIELGRDQVRKGSVLYSRQSGAVVVRLVVRLPRSKRTEGLARFVGEPAPPAGSVEDSRVEELTQEVEDLKAKLEATKATRKRGAAPKQ
jgi:proteasome lid subunit RPN8/RPN11